MIKTWVVVLLELSRQSQQIILATHNQALLKGFDLLMDVGKGDQVRFHSLFHGEDRSEVMVSSTNSYLELSTEFNRFRCPDLNSCSKAVKF